MKKFAILVMCLGMLQGARAQVVVPTLASVVQQMSMVHGATLLGMENIGGEQLYGWSIARPGAYCMVMVTPNKDGLIVDTLFLGTAVQSSGAAALGGALGEWASILLVDERVTAAFMLLCARLKHGAETDKHWDGKERVGDMEMEAVFSEESETATILFSTGNKPVVPQQWKNRRSW